MAVQSLLLTILAAGALSTIAGTLLGVWMGFTLITKREAGGGDNG